MNKLYKYIGILCLLVNITIVNSAADIRPELIENTKKSIITVNTRASINAYGRSGSWQGTGFIANKKTGYIVTNAHVAGNAAIGNYSITFYNGKQVGAKLIYIDSWQDFAILKIDSNEIPSDCTSLEFTTNEPKLGDHIFIVGNNEAQAFSFHEGYISDLYNIEGVMPQHSYTINMNTAGGSSGSPIIDTEGKAIGLNYGGSKTYALALKADYIFNILNALNANQPPQRQHIGVYATKYSLDKAVKHRSFPKDKMQEYMEKFPNFRNNSIIVASTIPGTPAEDKLKSGDILWKVNDKLIGASLYTLDNEMNNSKGSITLEVYRDGKLIALEIKTYNTLQYLVNRVISFGGAMFYEADEYTSAVTGVPLKTLFVQEVQPGSSFSVVPTNIAFDKVVYRFSPIKIGNYPLKNLDDLIKYLPNIAKEKYTVMAIKNYMPYYWAFDQIFCSNQFEYSVDINFEEIDTSARLYEFDAKTLEWKAKEISIVVK